ncbi:hypothetical protein GA0074696_3758 [Micromonospora purpureochromogenes]|uniref:Uncharacterized protein n=1 Tax=Micromonospora purpureochromogenes TaxID=47872 RepID=A0A1C4YVM2_9ACTN|nr:hypothetical protein [Micromonospora purpureochromogenes]SCF24793.1 hypothetical protein GA0074696_3758 [Micromonospora purpureochromogenes]
MSGRDSLGLHLTRPSPGAYQESAAAPRLWPAERTKPEQPVPPQRSLRFFAALLGLLGISATVTLAAPGLARASTVPVPARDGPTCPTEPAPDGLAGSSAISPSGYAKANVLALSGLGPFYRGQDDAEGARRQPERAAASGPPPLTTLLAAGSGPIVLALDCARPEPTPAAPGAGKTLPRIPAEPGQPLVAKSPVQLTGSAMTMTGLRIEGIVELPTAGGTLRALKFSMDRVTTDDARLRAPGSAGRTVRVATDQLTLSGEVAVYATRFVGRLPGVTITLSPELPLPPGIATTSPVPVTFTGVAVDLAFLEGHSLTARPALKLSVN